MSDSTGTPSSVIRETAWVLSRSPLAMLGTLYLVLVFLVAALLPVVAEDAATAMNLPMRSQPPFVLDNGLLYILGSDNLGRSLLARLALGARTSFLIAFSAVAIGMAIGVLLGVWAGYRSGWQATVIMRITDSIMSFPTLLLAIVLLYVLGGQGSTIIIVLAISRIPLFLRVARAEVLEVRERPFVSAARAMGLSPVKIIPRHILRVIAPTLMTLGGMELAFVMLSESSLSFIGLGVRSPDVSWGLMVSQGTQYLSSSWWLAVIPGTAIVLTALSLNLIVSLLRLYTDPKQKWRLGHERNG